MFAKKPTPRPRPLITDEAVPPPDERDQIKVNRAMVAKVGRVRGANRRQNKR